MLKNNLAEKVWITGFTTPGWILKAAANYSFIIVLSPLIVENLPLPKIGEVSLHSQRNFSLAIKSIVYDFFKVWRPMLTFEHGY